MPIDSHLPQADPFSLVPTFNGGLGISKVKKIESNFFSAVNFFHFGHSKPWIWIRIHIDKKFCIWIRIRIESNVDPQHCVQDTSPARHQTLGLIFCLLLFYVCLWRLILNCYLFDLKCVVFALFLALRACPFLLLTYFFPSLKKQLILLIDYYEVLEQELYF